MYFALGLLVLTAFFAYTTWRWALAIVDVPLNYISEPRYREPAPVNYHQSFAPVMMATATSAYATIPMPVSVYDPRTHRVVAR